MDDLVLLEKARLSVKVLEISNLLDRMRAFLRTSIDPRMSRELRDKMDELEAHAEQLSDRLLQLEAPPPVSESRQ